VPDHVVSAEQFTPDERRALAPYFTNLDHRVFALTNLPEVVKGALFARYSRSAKSVRRLFLDEFLDTVANGAVLGRVGLERAERLYERVFGAYGDDSVAQLGGAHIACEGVSNVLTKILERGRLMAYLEQSTRYVPFTDRPGGRWKYLVPVEIDGNALRERYVSTLDDAFESYARWFDPTQDYYRQRYPKTEGDSDTVYRAAIRAKALDTLRGLLPAATRSNVGIFGSGQAFEHLLLQMRAHPLAEARDCADRMLVELRKLIPAFLTRVDREDRGVRWSAYLADTRRETGDVAGRLLAQLQPERRPEVTLTDFDPDGEVKVVAAALYESSRLPDDQLLEIARRMGTDDRAAVLRAYVGDRANRRHRPGRAFERTAYCFDLLSDYGAFRDLQRHRLLTIEWQELSAGHGYTEPAAIEEVGAASDWRRVMDRTRELYDALSEKSSTVAQYAVAMAYRIRYRMQMNAREAMHVIELRTATQGHPAYRRVCQQMHRLIAEQAGHRAIADAMSFADHTMVELERLSAERAIESRQRQSVVD
jgi:thymidylate synthase ThyX|tara:strand:+ start:2326 stop:3933 length:1608 start_codon:yes stop_codon:yes gene_type:complete